VPAALHFTGDAEADELLAADPFALLVGFALDQQVPVPVAFAGPLKLRRRDGDESAHDKPRPRSGRRLHQGRATHRDISPP
jgi:hypothetical protein